MRPGIFQTINAPKTSQIPPSAGVGGRPPRYPRLGCRFSKSTLRTHPSPSTSRGGRGHASPDDDLPAYTVRTRRAPSGEASPAFKRSRSPSVRVPCLGTEPGDSQNDGAHQGGRENPPRRDQEGRRGARARERERERSHGVLRALGLVPRPPPPPRGVCRPRHGATARTVVCALRRRARRHGRRALGLVGVGLGLRAAPPDWLAPCGPPTTRAQGGPGSSGHRLARPAVPCRVNSARGAISTAIYRLASGDRAQLLLPPVSLVDRPVTGALPHSSGHREGPVRRLRLSWLRGPFCVLRCSRVLAECASKFAPGPHPSPLETFGAPIRALCGGRTAGRDQEGRRGCVRALYKRASCAPSLRAAPSGGARGGGRAHARRSRTIGPRPRVRQARVSAGSLVYVRHHAPCVPPAARSPTSSSLSVTLIPGARPAFFSGCGSLGPRVTRDLAYR